MTSPEDQKKTTKTYIRVFTTLKKSNKDKLLTQRLLTNADTHTPTHIHTYATTHTHSRIHIHPYKLTHTYT